MNEFKWYSTKEKKCYDEIEKCGRDEGKWLHDLKTCENENEKGDWCSKPQPETEDLCEKHDLWVWDPTEDACFNDKQIESKYDKDAVKCVFEKYKWYSIKMKACYDEKEKCSRSRWVQGKWVEDPCISKPQQGSDQTDPSKILSLATTASTTCETTNQCSASWYAGVGTFVGFAAGVLATTAWNRKQRSLSQDHFVSALV